MSLGLDAMGDQGSCQYYLGLTQGSFNCEIFGYISLSAVWSEAVITNWAIIQCEIYILNLTVSPGWSSSNILNTTLRRQQREQVAKKIRSNHPPPNFAKNFKKVIYTINCLICSQLHQQSGKIWIVVATNFRLEVLFRWRNCMCWDNKIK